MYLLNKNIYLDNLNSKQLLDIFNRLPENIYYLRKTDLKNLLRKNKLKTILNGII